MTLKICDLTQSYAPTGGGVRTYLHAKREHLMAEGGHEHVLIVPGAKNTVSQDGRSATYAIGSPHVPGSKVYRLLYRSDRVMRILKDERPDIVEVFCAYNLPWTALAYRRANRKAKVVGVYMTDLPAAYVQPVATRFLGNAIGSAAAAGAERYLRALYNRMDAVIAISPALAERLREMGVNNVRCIPLGVDLGVFNPSRRDPAMRARFGVAPNEQLLVYAGRLDGEKRAAVVMDAFERLPREAGARLVMAGDGPLAPALAERAARTGRARVVPFISDRTELARLLASADLYVSAMPYETFGLSVIEAQACGLPVVGVAGGAMVDRVPEGSGTGLLGPVDSAEAMADNILAMLGDEGRAAGVRAREMVEARFSWDATFAQVDELYSELLGQG